MTISRPDKERAFFVNKDDKDYPELLKEISNPPPSLTVLGALPYRNMPCIAMVGTRRATSKGMSRAREIARRLASRGAAIVSGLALGIDTASHQGALDAGGITVAVLPVGIDRVYPRQNVPLAKKIVSAGGALVTEYKKGTLALPNRFLERNRIISGMSIATIIIEAPYDSGALVTAREAAEAGREVLVFPGPSDHPNYVGSHSLIRDGARLVGSVKDILDDITTWTERYPLSAELPSNLRGRPGDAESEAERKALQILLSAGRPLSADEILSKTELDISVLNVALSTLILKEIIIESAGDKYELGNR